MTTQPDLSALDDKLLDGLEFCSKAYDLFDLVMAQPDALERIRIREDVVEKKLVEELLPIAHYVQHQYRAGNRFQIQWSNGSQPYDAILFSPQSMVEKAGKPEKIMIEATSALHPNDHVSRRVGHEDGLSWGPRSVEKDPKTGKKTTKAVALGHLENSSELAGFIIRMLEKKNAKNYPLETVLVINCTTFGIMYDDEWKATVEMVEKTNLHKNFREVYLVEPLRNRSVTLWGGSKNRRTEEPTA